MVQKRRQSQPKEKKTSSKADKPTTGQIPGITSEQRQSMIAETAYRIAEQRGFRGNAALDDWLQAESEVNVRLGFTE